MPKTVETDLVKLFHFPVEVFEKKEDGDRSYKIGGYASTEALDRQGEILVQKGLDFSEFLEYGWFNDNHSKATTGIVGYPELAEFHRGKGWYVQGYLIKGYEPAERIWALARALQKSTNRRLGFSVEGKTIARQNNKILKAKIKNVAITNSPINPECTLEILAKSFCLHGAEDECMECTKDCVGKAFEAGHAVTPAEQVDGGALRVESLEGACRCGSKGTCPYCKRKGLKSQTYQKSEVIKWMVRKGYSSDVAEKFWGLLKRGDDLHRIAKNL